MSDLRSILPTQIVRGALLRPDGLAVGLVGGGAPAWDLLAQAARAQAGSEYHRLLLALDVPLDVYMVDQPPDLAIEIGVLLDRQACAEHPLLMAVLSEMADYLTELARQSGSRAKQVIWAVTAGGDANARGVGGLDLGSLLARTNGAQPALPGRRATRAAPSALAQVVEQARRLADALSQLGGAPAARLLEAEEIARLVYGLADPVRAQRYPLAGTLLNRVRRVVAPAQHNAQEAH